MLDETLTPPTGVSAMEASAVAPDGRVSELSLLERYRADLPVALAPEVRDRVVICASVRRASFFKILTISRFGWQTTKLAYFFCLEALYAVIYGATEAQYK